MSEWKGRTRGGLAGHKIFVFFIRHFGLGFAYFFCNFVSLYFVFAARKATKSIYDFYRKRLKKSVLNSAFLTYRNFYTFGTVLIDKIALLSNTVSNFRLVHEGEDAIRELIRSDKGGIIINAHTGNWEIAGHLLGDTYKAKFNILMFNAEHENIKTYLESLKEKKGVGIILIGQGTDHLEKIREALGRSEFIAMNGDRFMEGNKTISCNFMGSPARFPAGPFYIAGKFNVPLVFAFSMKEKNRTYRFYASSPIYINDFNHLKKREENLVAAATYFAGELEKIMKRYPLQWFNYYDFWKTAS